MEARTETIRANTYCIGTAHGARCSCLGRPGAAPPLGLYRFTGEQETAAFGAVCGTLVELTVGALAAGLGIGRLADIADVLQGLGCGVIRGYQRQIAGDRAARREPGDGYQGHAEGDSLEQLAA